MGLQPVNGMTMKTEEGECSLFSGAVDKHFPLLIFILGFVCFLGLECHNPNTG